MTQQSQQPTGKTQRKPFPRKATIQRLLWCDRHCCLCEKPCGIDIELAHIDNDHANSNIENAIPVCYDCHARMGAYNDRHPRGNKLKIEEIKARREQIYEKYTRQYVAPLQYSISQFKNAWAPRQELPRQFPDVSLCVANLSDYLWTKLTVALTGILNGQKVELELKDRLYRGEKVWNLNPRRLVYGHFEIMNERLRKLRSDDRLEVRIQIIQEDPLGRRHELLQDGYVYKQGDSKTQDSWYFEP